MRRLRLAALAALISASASAVAHADLILISGQAVSGITTNDYGYTGKYYDKYGAGGTTEDVTHSGGGPVAFLYIFSNTGLSVYYDAKAGAYENNDDTQIGVINDMTTKLNYITLSSTVDIFGFDGDGISSTTYGAPGNAMDTTKYGGALGYFTGINASKTEGTVNFIDGLAANGGTTFFSLENAPSVSMLPAPAPEPTSLMMVGCGIILVNCAVRLRRRVGAALVA